MQSECSKVSKLSDDGLCLKFLLLIILPTTHALTFEIFYLSSLPTQHSIVIYRGLQCCVFVSSFREKVGLKVVKALKRTNEAVTHAAIDMVCALMQPMHDDYDIKQEQMNKASLLSSEKFLNTLLEILTTNVVNIHSFIYNYNKLNLCNNML